MPHFCCCAGCEIGVASTKAYTSQIVVITMMALALSEDSISKRDLRDEIIDSMAQLPDKIRQVGIVGKVLGCCFRGSVRHSADTRQDKIFQVHIA